MNFLYIIAVLTINLGVFNLIPFPALDGGRFAFLAVEGIRGKPLDRSSIWKMMKQMCESAGVEREKVFPHNLRHLFARTYYSIQKDIVRLADILGHSSVNTTRIYTMETSDVHRRQIQELGLLRL